MLALGAFLGVIPSETISFEHIYEFFTTEFSSVILLVFIPLLIFEAGRKLELGQIKKEAVPIGFFAIIGVIITIFLIGLPISFVFDVPFLDREMRPPNNPAGVAENRATAS